MPDLLQPQHLHQALNALGLTYSTNERGAGLLEFDEDGKSPRHNVIISVENEGRVLVLQFGFGVPGMEDMPFEAMLYFTNTWNTWNRWPRATAALDKNGRTTARSSVSVPVLLGASVEQLQEMLRVLLHSGRAFGIELAGFVSTRAWSLDDEDLARLLEPDA